MISFFKLLFKEDKKSILKTAYRSLVIFSVFQGLSISVCNFLFLKFNGLQAYEPYTIAIYLSFMLLSLVAIGISALMIACAFYFYLELKKEEKQIKINS